MNWNTAIQDFVNYLRLERGMAENTITSYQRDLKKAAQLCADDFPNPLKMELKDLEELTALVVRQGLSARSQARFISTLRSFYRYFLLEDELIADPTELLESPRIGQKLPIFYPVKKWPKYWTI
ncbi:MAG: site-specific integrase [Owenweeksia sp.]|nr:site-specific integrase [Owenweeksia sp.]